MTALREQAATAAEKQVRTARLQREVCTPRGFHVPEMTKRFMVADKPYIYRLCADCHGWVNPTPITPMDTNRGVRVVTGFAR